MKSKTFKNGCLAVAVSTLFLGFSGCGPASDQPELGQVTGTVTLDGKPLSGVAVVFQPDNGRPAHGTTDAQGHYELRYIRETMGTKIGHNRVEIAPQEGEDDETEELQGDEETPAAVAPRVKSGKPKIPPRYNIRSELEADVKPGENTFDFALESSK